MRFNIPWQACLWLAGRTMASTIQLEHDTDHGKQVQGDVTGAVKELPYPEKPIDYYGGRNDDVTYYDDETVNGAGKASTIFRFGEDNNTSVINAFGKDYNLDDIVSIEELMHQPDEPSVPDLDYFRFNEANLNASGQALFYAAWSIKAQENPEFRELGEWSLFGKEFFNTYNFECGFEYGSCQNKLSLHEIKVLYPENRPLVRLIYFTMMKYSMLHDYTRAIEKQFHDVYEVLVGLIPSLIYSFTHQADPHKLLMCQHVHTAVQQAIQLSITVAGIAVGGWGFPVELVIGAGFSESLKNAGRNKINNFRTYWKWPENKLKTLSNKPGKWKSVNKKLAGSKKQRIINFDVNGQLVYNVPGWLMTAYNDNKDNWIPNALHIDQGFGHAVLCGSWEGDASDRNLVNKDALQEYLFGHFEMMEKETRRVFRKIYEGQIVLPGRPSMMALMMMNRKWDGPNSIRSDMRDMEPMKEMMQRAIIMDTISRVLARDGNYIKCTHRDDAERLCKEASKKRKGWLLSIFCPRPVTDPELICQAARWYWHQYSSHEITMAGLNSFDTFQSNRLKMNRVDMLIEAYNHYDRRGNNMAVDWKLWAMGNIGDAGFKMPVCVNDQLEITNFGGKGEGPVWPHEEYLRQWKFPAICGNFRANETRGFMNAIGAGIGSMPYNKTDFDMEMLSGQLWRDRVPRVLEGLSPYSHYMAMGEIGIQWPDATIKKYPRNVLHNFFRIFTGIDKDFEMIKNATANMTEWQSNYWFCAGKAHHSVFQRERNHIDMPTFPLNSYKSHARKCDAWWEKNEPERNNWERGERW